MEKNYFNKAVTFGIIDNIKERTAKNEKKTPYLDIFIKCSSGLNGNFLTRFRLWDREAIGDVKQTNIQNPGVLWRFEGYVEQYEKADKLLSGASGFKAEVLKEETTQRSTFILKGKFNGQSVQKERRTIRLGIIVQKTRDDKTEEQEFFVEIRDQDREALGFNIKDIVRGDILHMRGHLTDLDAEFGSSGNLALLVEKYDFIKEPVEDKGGFE